MPKLCLNMIVKNESKNITRLFDSVIDIIDYYCICDTGSIDNTVEIIKNYFQSKQKPGRVVVEPFKNFEHNRTFALHACENDPNVDFILLMDADMVLVKGRDFDLHGFKQSLQKADVFHLFQGNDKFSYKNIRIVKNNIGIKYWGLTHEVINTPSGTKYHQFDRNVLFINDIGDGGAKADKFERDIRLLTQGLVEKPNNGRYIFYLANSYRDYGDEEKAIEMYKKRITIGGWFDEVWYSYYSIGRCYKLLGNTDSAIANWMLAYDYFPKRLENIYEIIKYYRSESKHKLAYEFYKIALKQLEGLDKSKIDYLFLQNDIYDYKIDYEYTIVGYYYNPDNIDLAALSMRVMCAKNIEKTILKNVLSNYKFYCKPLFTHEISTKPDLASGVNANTMCYPETIGFGYNNHNFDCSFVVLENDATTLFKHIGETHFVANRESIVVVNYETNQCVQSSFIVTRVKCSNNDKEWALFADTDDRVNVVYNWWPMTTYAIGHASMLIDKKEITVPRFFEFLCGSTNGVRVGNETWFIAKSYEDQRYYYNILVALELTENKVTRWSRFFTLDGEKVEYISEFIPTLDDKFTIKYSTMDNASHIHTISRIDLERLFE